MSTPLSKTQLMESIRDPRHDGTWTVDDLKEVDVACEVFEQSWQAGAPVDISAVLTEHEQRLSRLLFRELLAIEIEYRQKRGEVLSSQLLTETFPDCTDLVTLACEESLRPNPAADAVPEFLVRHPRYEITGRLGMGGMGTVYSGRHTVLGRDVAIKVIRRELLTAPGSRERFLREARTAARLQHPNVVAVYDAEATDEAQFLVMEAVPGADLAKTVADHGPLPWEAACDAIHQAALGLEAARKIGLVHRDLSPRNLMLADDGTVKLLDFGLASLTSAANVDQQLVPGMLVGSAPFMSPEQVNDPSSSDVRSDLYSLGCVMFFLLTGQPPFEATALPDLLEAHRSQFAPNVSDLVADIPADVSAIVARLLAKSPADRYQTPVELARALEMASGTVPQQVTTRDSQQTPIIAPMPPAVGSTKSRRSAPWFAAGLAVALLVAVVVYRDTMSRSGQPAAAESPDFVQGLSLLGQRQERQVRRAIEKFQGIINRDPHHARAYAALAEAYNLCGDYGWELPDNAFPKAIAAAKKALELDEELPEGRLALAFAAATYTCDWQDAERQFRLTLEAAPNLAAAHHWFAWFLVQQGRFEEAKAQIDEAQSLAADNLIITNNVGRILYFSRKYAEAAEKHRAALDLDQDFQKAHMDLGYALIELGRSEEALAEIDKGMGISTNDWDVQAARAYALARLGNSADVLPLLQSLEPVADDEGLSLEMAHIYAAMGDFDQAFRWLNAAFARKSPGRAGIAVDPRYDPLRKDPRFKPLLQSIGLAK